MSENKEKKEVIVEGDKKLSFKDRMLKLKDKALELKDDLVEKSADTLSKSALVIKDIKELDKIVADTIPKDFTNKETGITKQFKKYALIIFVKKDTTFYKDSLLEISVLATKAWTQNITLKLTDLEYNDIKEFPSLVLFENKQVHKILSGEENIKKIVKNMEFDIIKLIKKLSE